MDSSVLFLLICGLTLLVVGGEMLVRGAARMASALGMTPLAIGLTVVAYGTAAPEVATSVTAVLEGQADVAFGNVVGSNIFNVLFILGTSAMILPLVVAQRLVRVDVPIMIGVSLLCAVMAWDGRVSTVEGLLLLVGLITYTISIVRASRQEAAMVKQEYEQQFGNSRGVAQKPLRSSLAMIVAGLVLLVIGSHWLIESAVGVASALGVSELVIGLTVVAAGTSLPEVTTSILAAVRGERDIAVGNVVGSNIFNILGVLGITSAISSDGVSVPVAAMNFDVPVMIGVAIACLPIFFTGHLLARWEGAVLLSYYVAYTSYLILHAIQHDLLPAFSWVMMVFTLPLTLLTFLIFVVRERWLRVPLPQGDPIP